MKNYPDRRSVDPLPPDNVLLRRVAMALVAFWVAMALLVWTTSANATVKPELPNKPQSQHQAQDQEQHQAQTQTQSATTGASTSSSSTGASTSANSLSQSYQDKLQAPAVFAPAVYASGPCNTGWSAGASGPGAGLSFGKSKTDPSCDRRELARVLTPLNPQLALKILCADPIAKEVATEKDCLLDPLPANDKPTVVILEGDHSGLATTEQLERAFKANQGK